MSVQRKYYITVHSIELSNIFINLCHIDFSLVEGGKHEIQSEKCDLTLAVNNSLGVFGEPGQQALIYHLWKVWGIDILSPDVTLSEIENAITSIFGEAAVLILDRLHTEIENSQLK